MYRLLLILKYLRRRLAPLFAALAVTLCTAMVIIVMSVMGGFLDLMRTAAQSLTGDVTVLGDYRGFPHYQELIASLESRPELAAATPVIRAPGMAKFGSRVHLVEVLGIEPQGMDAVNDFRRILYWTTQKWLDALPAEAPDRTGEVPGLDLVEMAMTFRPPQTWRVSDDTAGAIIGIEVNPIGSRDAAGQYDIYASSLGAEMTLTVVPLTAAGGVTETSSRSFIVVNEFKSGLYEIDANRIYVPLASLQAMLRMDEGQEADPETGLPTGQVIPARTSEVVVRGAPGYTLSQVEQAVRDEVGRFMDRHREEMPHLGTLTWEQRHSSLLSAVQNEKGLITFLFAVISLVAIVMVATTFYMIVLEKTRDIGVLRALGASRGGIAGVFLGYGLAIGLVGASLGAALAVLIVTNLNPLQDLLDHWFGWRMWDPRIYYFDRIPDRVDPTEALWIVIAAILSSVVGSLIPALLAARLDPVEALRYE